MDFPQYLIPPLFCPMKTQLSDTFLYPAVPSAACFGQRYCSWLVLIKGECLWIMWLCNLEGQVGASETFCWLFGGVCWPCNLC